MVDETTDDLGATSELPADSSQAEEEATETAPPKVPGEDDKTDAERTILDESATNDLIAELRTMIAPGESPEELGRLGPYRLLRVLGGGGMGIVALAEDCQLRRKAALKVMRPALVRSKTHRQRFLREAQAAAAIEHDHIVPIFHVGEDRNVPYVAMPFLRGETLDDRLKRGPLSQIEIVRIGREIALGLSVAHDHSLVHRDIKPSNIWLEIKDEGGRMKDEKSKPSDSSFSLPPSSFRVKILDFGVAAGSNFANADASPLTPVGAVIGTVGYFAPEQATAQIVDQRTDLFSLGCVLYRMCTGKLPFTASDLLANLSALALEVPASPTGSNPELVPELCDLVMRLLEKKPENRPRSAADVARTLARIERELLDTPQSQSRPSEPDRTPPRRVPPRPASGQVWASDANQIDIDDLESVVFKNEIIIDFLERRGRYFLSANKGLGKTLLLSYKRKQLSGAHQEARQGKSAQVHFIPEGRPFLDFMGNLPSLPATHVSFLEDLTNTKRLWSLALRVSALSHHASLVGEEDAADLEAFPKRLQTWMKGSKVEPTVVFKEMLGSSVKEINRLIDWRENFLEQKFRQIHGATFFFIDKVDQGLRSLPRPAWINVQAGLIEAAWDAMNANAHVKVYASIRQEAFSNYESDIKTNLFGATTVLQYSDADLEALLDRLTQCYESGESFKDFIKLGGIPHPCRPVAEDSFRFLRRHTLGRPRDLVIIASEVSRNQNELTEALFRSLVKETAGTMLVPNVFEEMRVFLNCLEEKQERLRFIALLPHNILTRDEVVRVYYQFNYLDPDCPAFDHYSDKLHHPFWELYSAGLLGVVDKEPDSTTLLQRFRQPSEMFNDALASLPDVDYYVVHPALDGFIRKNRPRGDYHMFQHVVVGHNRLWQPHYGLLLDVERRLFTVTDTSLCDQVHDVLKDLTGLLYANKRPASVLLNAPNWIALKDRLLRKNDELYLLLDELIARA